MLTEPYYLHVSLSINCTGTSPTRLVIGLICYRHSYRKTWKTTVQSQGFLQTKDSQVFLQTDQ